MLGKSNSPTELHPQSRLLYCNCYWLGEEIKKGWSFGQHSMLGHDTCLLRFWVGDPESSSQGSLCSQEAADYPAKPVFTSYKERDRGTFLKILSLRSIFKQAFTWLRLKTEWKVYCINNNNHAFRDDNHNAPPFKGFSVHGFFFHFIVFYFWWQNSFNEKTRKKEGVGEFGEGKGNKLNICKKDISKKIC